MKKILLLFSICLIPMLGYAQTDENGKERVYIDYFSRPGTISNILAEALRNKVIEGIQKMDRVELIDVDSNEALKTEAKRRQEASAMGDAVCRSEVMTTLGAQYLIEGNITSMQGVKKTDSKGKTYYESEFITINPETTIIRLSFLTNANRNLSLTEVPNGNYWMYNVSLDELELFWK